MFTKQLSDRLPAWWSRVASALPLVRKVRQRLRMLRFQVDTVTADQMRAVMDGWLHEVEVALDQLEADMGVWREEIRRVG